MALHPKIADVTARIEERSRDSRRNYLDRIDAARKAGPGRQHLSCGNLAHAFAAVPLGDKLSIRGRAPNIGIVTSYNDMLSAHQPFKDYPDIIKDAARKAGGTAQVAGGTPAMCDGVTQGRPGMELSLFSRDVIALSTAVALTHDAFDAGLMLGTCDKIVPGLVIGALSFGHLPIIFSPAGPMPSGISNKEKARVREQFALGQVTRETLLEAEAASYHTAGTCTFYGTANSNQMMMELMGLHLPGTAFINPDTPLRDALVRAAAARCIDLAKSGESLMAHVVDAKSIVNAIVGLMATGGSTNHALHLPAMAQAAGIIVDWNDFSDISSVTRLLARVYPNGTADINQFHAAGGMAFITRELLLAGLLHGDTVTVAGAGLGAYTQEPWIDGDRIAWREGATKSLDENILRPVSSPFEMEGGIRLLKGNLGRGVIKISSVPSDRRIIDAPAAVFESQADFSAAFKAGQARPRCGRRRPLPGPARQRHARTARADAAAHRAAEQGLPRRPRHRRPHVRRLGRDSRRDPCDPRRRPGHPPSPASRTATASCSTPSMAVSTLMVDPSVLAARPRAVARLDARCSILDAGCWLLVTGFLSRKLFLATEIVSCCGYGVCCFLVG